MKMPKRGERGFTLIELLIVVAILGILAAVVVPNVGRFLGRGKEEARRAELHDIGTAITAVMVENALSSIPTPATAIGTGCTVGTKDMTVYPDSASVAGSANKLKDPSGVTYVDLVDPLGDKNGYILFGHDLKAGDNQVLLTNYVSFNKTTYCYTVAADGTVRQYNDAGVEQVQ